VYPAILQAVRQGPPGVVPLRAANIPFCNVIPGGAIFLGPQNFSHLTTFDGMPSKFL
jgi:hypothetical protein